MARPIEPKNQLGMLIADRIYKMKDGTISEWADTIKVNEKTVREWINDPPDDRNIIIPKNLDVLESALGIPRAAILRAFRTPIDADRPPPLAALKSEEAALFSNTAPLSHGGVIQGNEMLWFRAGIPVDVIPGPHIKRFGLGGIIFREHAEDGNLIRVELDTKSSRVPVALVPSILQEIDQNSNVSQGTKEFIQKRYRTIEGNNTYARLRAVQIDPFTYDHGDTSYRLVIDAEKSSYIVGALRELSMYPAGTSKTFDENFADKNIANLGVEILLTSASSTSQHGSMRKGPDATRRVALQRRSDEVFTFKCAWDVSAAGFIDCLAHRNFQDVLSIVKAATRELEEEISVPSFILPNEEHFEFFGIMHVRETGHTDVVGQCVVDDTKFDTWFQGGNVKIRSKFVDQVTVINLTPRAVRNFLKESEGQRYWNPTGFLTLIAALRRAGFEPADIWAELDPVIPQMDFRAHRP